MRNKAPTVWPVPIQLLGLIADELRAQGVTTMSWLEGSGLQPSTIGEGDRVLSYDTTLKVIAQAFALAKIPGFGIDVGKRQTPSGWGILGYAINCCATAGDALEMGVKYHRVSPSLNGLELRHDAEQAYWIVTPPVPLEALLPFAVEEEFAAFCRAGPLLTGKPVPLREAHFTYPAPPYASRYAQVWDCPHFFNSDKNQLVLDAKCLDYPILQANPLSVATATRLCEQFLTTHPTTDQLTMQIRRHLLEQPGHYSNAEELAQHLKITSRTLRNRLRQSGQSFQSILNGVREQLAKDYLREAPLKVEDIASRLKFSDARSFRRAFKNWTGMTPDDFRHKNTHLQP
jgi:AraC-like DNA-binding protein